MPCFSNHQNNRRYQRQFVFFFFKLLDYYIKMEQKIEKKKQNLLHICSDKFGASKKMISKILKLVFLYFYLIYILYMLCTDLEIVLFAYCTTKFLQFSIGTGPFVPNLKYLVLYGSQSKQALLYQIRKDRCPYKPESYKSYRSELIVHVMVIKDTHIKYDDIKLFMTKIFYKIIPNRHFTKFTLKNDIIKNYSLLRVKEL